MRLKNSLLLVAGLIGLDQVVLLALQAYRPEWLHLAYYLLFSIHARELYSVVVFLLLLTVSSSRPRLRLPLVLATAGYLSTVITLLRLGYMVDYVSFPWWYTNLADCYIVVGCLWFFIQIMTTPKTAR
jgi:lipoprotein signal peptidase